MSEGPPLENLSGSFVTWQQHKEENIILRIMQVTPDYFGTMNIKPTAGRLFYEKLTTDNNTFILNEAAVKYLGIPFPIGQTIKTFGKDGEIIGVVK